MNTVETLRKAGFYVKVLHTRPFSLILRDKSRGMNTRKQVVYLPKYFKNNSKFKLIERGGYTTVTLFKEGNRIAEEIAICSEKDNFCFKIGVSKAISKMNLVLAGD